MIDPITLAVGVAVLLTARGKRMTSDSPVSLSQLRTVMPKLSEAKATEYLPYLNAAMREFAITSPLRISAFLAQIAHESVELRYFEEIASGDAYEWRGDLGNIYAGDGRKFKGRGPIQLTGRNNYTWASIALGVDLVNSPELAATKHYGFRIAGLYWQSKGLNAYADARNFDTITKLINGGYNGKAYRDAYYVTAKRVFGV